MFDKSLGQVSSLVARILRFTDTRCPVFLFLYCLVLMGPRYFSLKNYKESADISNIRKYFKEGLGVSYELGKIRLRLFNKNIAERINIFCVACPVL